MPEGCKDARTKFPLEYWECFYGTLRGVLKTL